jgi:hypothetical protein
MGHQGAPPRRLVSEVGRPPIVVNEVRNRACP